MSGQDDLVHAPHPHFFSPAFGNSHDPARQRLEARTLSPCGYATGRGELFSLHCKMYPLPAINGIQAVNISTAKLSVITWGEGNTD